MYFMYNVSDTEMFGCPQIQMNEVLLYQCNKSHKLISYYNVRIMDVKMAKVPRTHSREITNTLNVTFSTN